jgi:hypothetical protein
MRGFTSVGDREPPADEKQRGVYNVEGDDMGNNSQFTIETKLHCYNAPVLAHLNLFPFIFGNYILINPLGFNFNESRGAVGFGIGWALNVGRIDL